MLKPRRPLNPYQRFFREERARVLGLSLEATGVSATHAGDFAASSLSAEEVPSPGTIASPTAAAGTDTTTAVYAEPLAKKRKHRKTHGKISFQQLSSHVSKAWKVLDPKTKETFQAEFQILLKKFKMDLEEYYDITAKKEQELAAMQNGAAAAASLPSPTAKSFLGQPDSKKKLLQILPATMDQQGGRRMENVSVTSSAEDPAGTSSSARARVGDFSKLFGNMKLTQSKKTFKKRQEFEEEEDACSDVEDGGEEAYYVQPSAEEKLALESLAMIYSTGGASHSQSQSHMYNHLNSQSHSQLESLQRKYHQQRERSSTLPHYLPSSAAASIRPSAAGGYAHDGQHQTNLQAQAQARLHILEQAGARLGSEALLRRPIHNLPLSSQLHEHHIHLAYLSSFLAGAGDAASLVGHHGSSLSAHHAASALTHAHPSFMHHSAPSYLTGHRRGHGHAHGHAGGPSASDVAAAMITLNAAAAQAQAQRYHEEQQQNTVHMNPQAHSRAETMLLLQLIEREREQRQQVHAQQQHHHQAQAAVVTADAVRSSSNSYSNSSSGNGGRAAAASSALLKRAMVQMSRDYASSALETARSKRVRTTHHGGGSSSSLSGRGQQESA
jgi:hypothetical protein